MPVHHPYEGEELLAALRAGDERAFAKVYDHFHQRVFFFALRFVQENDAKDVTSEAFAKVWARRTQFTALDGIGTFLFVLVRNRCLDLVRHQVIKARKHEELIHLLESSHEEDLFKEEVRAALIRHIYNEAQKLPPRVKEIFLLSFEAGLKPSEIAGKLQISVQTVSNQKLNAIRLLKAALGEHSSVILMLVLLSADSWEGLGQ